MLYKIILFCFLAILFVSEIRAESSLNLRINISEDFNKDLKSEVSIRLPNGKTDQLYFDKLNTFESYKKNFFQISGDYELIITFKHSSPKEEVIKHSFNVDLNEQSIDLNIRFRMSRVWDRESRSLTSEYIARGYISINKYYNTIDGVVLQPNDLEPSDDYRGPYFTIMNKSDKIIYGEFLPGYFWGRLYSLNEDLTIRNKLYFRIDLNFTRREPLMQNSSRIATVGSFGYSNQLDAGLYRFKLLYKLDDRNHSHRKLNSKGDFEWWISEEELYTVTYDFVQ